MRSLLSLVVLLLLAGCVGRGAEEPEAPVEPAQEREAPSFVLPDGRGVSAAENETNRTEAGVGGVDHKHD